MLGPISKLIDRARYRRAALLNASHIFWNKALNALVPLLLIPYFNGIFGVAQYGELIAIQAIATLLIYFTDYGFLMTATREVTLHARNNERLSALVSTVLLIKLALTGVVFIAIWGTAAAFGLSGEAVVLYTLTFGAMSLQNFMPNWFFQGMKRNGVVTTANIVSKAVLLVLVFAAIREGSPLWMAPLVECIAYAVFFAFGLYLVLTTFKLRFSVPPLGEITANFRLGRDNFLTTLMSWGTTGGVLLLTEQLVSPQSFGYYGTFTRIAYYVFAAVHQINLAVFPYVAERFHRSAAEGKALVRSLSKLYVVIVAMLLIAGMALGGPFLATVFDSDFNRDLSPELPTFYVLVVWVALVLMTNFVGLHFFVARRMDAVYRRYYGVNVFVCLAGCALLTPRIGTLGAALATTIGEALLLTLLLNRYLAETRRDAR